MEDTTGSSCQDAVAEGGSRSEDRSENSTTRHVSTNEHYNLDQDWDIRSPLVPRIPFQNDTMEQFLTTMQIERMQIDINEEDGDDGDDINPLKILLGICSSATAILFLGLILGSFFYPWFDAKVRCFMGKTSSLPFHADLVSDIF
jgi:hypothetical protein